MATVILGIGVLVFVAHFFTALFRRTRIPDVLLLMMIGVVLGPVTHRVTTEDFGKLGGVMSTLALIVILFESGITLQPDALARSIRTTLAITIPTFVATLVITWAFSVNFLGASQMLGWIMGAVLGGVSSAVVIPLVKSVRASGMFATTMIIESVLGDVLSIVVLLALIEAEKSGELSPARMLGSVMSSLLMAAIIGILGGFSWLMVLNKVRQLPDTAFTTLAVVFILYGVADELGFSGAIAALAFGATLTNYNRIPLRKFQVFRERELARIDQQDVAFFMEVLFLLKTFFFVYLGASINFEDLLTAQLALTLCVSLYAVRLVIVRIFARHPTLSWRDLSLASFMVPKGLVAAVLAGVAADSGIQGVDGVRNFVYMVVFVSICLTAISIPLVERRPFSSVLRFIFSGAPDPEPEPTPAAERPLTVSPSEA